jgi:hypothetical protein
MKLTVLFDIDGTIADIKHRRSYLDGSTPDWRSFNSKMGDDTPNYPVVELYKTLWDSERYHMFLVSGRGEEHRKITETWLTWNSIPFERLLMRPRKDFRPDVEIKQEILLQLKAEGKEISFVVDDRNSVVDMWRKNNVTCLQCAEGNF